jgi:hypothetical protein
MHAILSPRAVPAIYHTLRPSLSLSRTKKMKIQTSHPFDDSKKGAN